MDSQNTTPGTKIPWPTQADQMRSERQMMQGPPVQTQPNPDEGPVHIFKDLAAI